MVHGGATRRYELLSLMGAPTTPGGGPAINAGQRGGVGICVGIQEPNTSRGMAAKPLVVDGVMYTSGNRGVVSALDAYHASRSGSRSLNARRDWTSRRCCAWSNRGSPSGRQGVSRLPQTPSVCAGREDRSESWKSIRSGEVRGGSSTGAPQLRERSFAMAMRAAKRMAARTRRLITPRPRRGKAGMAVYTVCTSATWQGLFTENATRAATWDPGISPA